MINRLFGAIALTVSLFIAFDSAAINWGGEVGIIVPTPATPSNVAVPAKSSNGSYSLTWTKPLYLNAGKYQIEESRNSGAYVAVASPTASTLSYAFSGKTAAVYRYRINACNVDVNKGGYKCSGWGYSGYISVSSVPSTPAVPTGPTSDTDGAYSIAWTKPSGTVSYYSLQERANSGNWTTVTSSTSATSRSFSSKASATYDYRVRACNTSGCSSYSGYKRVVVVIDTGSLIADQALISPTVPAQQAVGALQGSAGVSGGAANYSVPIALPPGRAGMQPGVSLNYSSRSGNGIAGVGWNLSAGSAISRCARTVAQDGFNLAVTYSATDDRLCLDGQRLIPVNLNATYGGSGTVYRTEIDSFARVTQNGSINSASSWFKVEHKNGRVTLYGSSADSRHSAQGKTEVLSWAIKQTEDRSVKRNNIIYSYQTFGAGEHLLTNIAYTGALNSAGDRKVTLSYENRPLRDKSHGYMAGGKTANTKRLSWIRTYVGSSQIRSYQLKYGTASLSTNRTLLREVVECGYVGTLATCLPSTTFDWQELATEYKFEKLRFDNNGTPQEVGKYADGSLKKWLHEILPRGDDNGDGVKDWPEGYVDAEGRLTGTPSETPLQNCYKPFNSFTLVCLEADFDHDGYTDNFKRANDRLLIKHSRSNAWVDSGIAWNDTLFPFSGPTGLTTYETVEDKPLLFADYNGDGWVDVAFYHTNGLNNPQLWVYYNNKSNSGAQFSTNNRQLIHTYQYDINLNSYCPGFNCRVFYQFTTDVQAQNDLDGNGTPDFTVFNLGTNFPALPAPSTILFTKPNSSGRMDITTGSMGAALPSSNLRAHIFFDINSDGLADWLQISATDQKTYVKINKGGYFDGTWQWAGFDIPLKGGLYGSPTEPLDYFYPNMNRVLLMDYNNDGRTDVLTAKDIKVSSCALVQSFDSGGNNASNWRCDRGLAGNFMQTQYSGAYTPIDQNLVDDTVWSWDVTYIQDDLTTVTEGTNIIASLTQKVAVDVFGNGLTDIISIMGCRFSDCVWGTDANSYLNGNAKSMSGVDAGVWVMRNVGVDNLSDPQHRYDAVDMLSSVKTGLDIESNWDYRPLSTGDYQSANDPFYNADHINYDSEYFQFASSMYAVAEFKQSNGIGGKNTTRYRYDNAVFNTEGRGFQGFYSITVDNVESGIRSVTDFHQTFPRAGKIKSTRSCLISNGGQTCSSNILSRTDNLYLDKTTANSKLFWVVPSQSININYEMTSKGQTSKTTTTINPSYLDTTFGNIGETTSIVDNGFTQVKRQSISTFSLPFDQTNWWINKLKDSTVTSETLSYSGVYDATLDTKKSVKTTYSWTAERQPNVVSVIPQISGGKTASVDTDYNSYGLPTQIKTYEGLTASNYRKVNTTYSKNGESESADGYFAYRVSNSLNQTITTKTYPAHGQAKQVSDVNGFVSSSRYDVFGRVEKITPPVGTGQPVYKRFAFCDGSCDGLTDSRFKYKETSYTAGAPDVVSYKDQFNRTVLTRTTQFNGSYVYSNARFDSLGRPVFESIPSASRYETKGTTYVNYDAIGRLTQKQVSQTNGQIKQINYNFGYANNPYRTQIVVNNNQTLFRTNSGNGQLMQTTDAFGSLTRYAYDSAGNPIVLQDANQANIKAKYNDIGQKLWVNDPNMGLKYFYYNGFGEVEKETDAKNVSTQYQYDPLGRLEYRSVNNVLEATFDYDLSCNGTVSMETVNRSSEKYSKSYVYDQYCRPSTSTSTIDGNSYDITQYYDGNYGRVKGLTYPNDLTVEYQYNGLGYQNKTKNALTGLVYREITQVDILGNWTRASQSNGSMTIERNYHIETGQMVSTQLKKGSSIQQLASYNGYDDRGNLTAMSVGNRIAGSYTVDNESYAYDGISRLIRSNQVYQNNLVNEYNYAYDAVGNFTYKSDFSAINSSAYLYGNATKSLGGNAGSNAARRVTLANGKGYRYYSYDANGNMTNDGSRAYIYNAFNKPTEITVSANQRINPNDTLLSASSSMKFYYGANQLRYKQVKTSSGTTTTTIYIDKMFEEIRTGSSVTSKSYVGDIAVVTQQGTSTNSDTKYIHRDRLGGMIGSFDSSGNLVQHHSYDPFGKPRDGRLRDNKTDSLTSVIIGRNILGSSTTNRGFTDHEHLDDAQLIHMNGRVYDYNLGRFLSVDPFIQSPGNSQSMNPYSYIMNNPLAGTDPSGYAAKKKKRGASDSDSVCKLNLCGAGAKGLKKPKDNGNTVKQNVENSKPFLDKDAANFDFESELPDITINIDELDLSGPVTGATGEVGGPSTSVNNFVGSGDAGSIDDIEIEKGWQPQHIKLADGVKSSDLTERDRKIIYAADNAISKHLDALDNAIADGLNKVSGTLGKYRNEALAQLRQEKNALSSTKYFYDTSNPVDENGDFILAKTFSKLSGRNQRIVFNRNTARAWSGNGYGIKLRSGALGIQDVVNHEGNHLSTSASFYSGSRNINSEYFANRQMRFLRKYD